ncbi:LDL receptor repeat-containing protein egg-1-like [Nematostella vectensis]|uniref:LDL receptor repeat-containing protein egg-1-like n=1 Tax=Nematostella vectensis TaxID=45351 RepID=UPI00138FCDC3|nr:LDL receptor repeat-containing protein egg-1-like [Nematostella vectensis]
MGWNIAVCCLYFVAMTAAHPYTIHRSRREAAKNSAGGSCAADRYRCDNGKKCIPLKWICDSVADCDDKRDERNCIPANQIAGLNSKAIEEAKNILQESTVKGGCAEGQFACEKTNKCLAKSSLCDTVHDCDDGSDEKNCPISSRDEEFGCGSDKFTCDNGAKCLPLTWLCDSITDCMDSKDEHNCPATIPGKTLARAAQDAAVTAAQEAKRAALAADNMMKKAQEAVEKAKRAMAIAEANES